ncbi:MAG: SAM-dependent methyltransferase [Thermoanaerobaculia bacterium]|nr:SAM-dependent methyltransferase [Thermoanaerobaculia bacterium]
MIAGLDIIDILDFTPGVVDMKEDVGRLSALKRHYVNQVKENDFGVDAIYFSGEFPSVYFKAVPDFREPVLKELLDVQRKIWNQGKVPFLYAESPVEIRIYNCYEKPRHLTKDSVDLELVQASKRVAEELNVLKQVFGKISIETGNFWKEKVYPDKVRNETRVDRSLIDNLKQTRRILYNQGKGLSKEVIHDLLLRSLFLLYLEDREATDAKLYEGRKGYFEVLDDIDVTYRVYEKLEQSFNGNLSPVTPTERAIVTNDHLTEIKNCFWSGRTLFFGWRFFDFKIIPIQLISEIYEDFLSEEIGEEQKNAAGAFYTPHPLAEFVLNEALPHASVDHINYNVKVLDPTCGSGIFLVETLNRLIDRWLLANPGKRFSFEIAKQIVLDNIFGIEKKRAAIKVAAFSLYLAMIDRLEPKTLWQAVTFPYLIYDPTSEDADKQGKNLFCMSSLESGPFEGIDFDLLVGNPPFGGRKVEKDVRAYLENQRFGNETVEAFLHRATELCPTGKIALISTSKILFNTGNKHRNFRRFLFNDCYVEKVYNFSILRRVPQSRGRNLFSSTVRPISVFLYSAQSPAQPSDRLIYCAPTTAIKNRIIDGIAIDSTDLKYLPREECKKPDTKIWKAAMWGTERDFSLIKEFQSRNSLLDALKEKGWETGVGFQVSTPLKFKDKEIQQLPFLPSVRIDRYYTKIDKTEKIYRDQFRRLGNKLVYNTPHVLIKKGQSDKKFCASYLDYPCSFRDGVFGIWANHSHDELKILTALLNSELASYIMFLTTGNWGIEREQFMPNEVLDLPDICFTLPKKAKEKIIDYVDEIITHQKNEFFYIDSQITILERKIEATLWDALNLSETDKILIEDLLNYQLDAFQSGQKSNAYKPCSLDDSKAYAHYLCKTINEFLKYTPGISVSASVLDVHKRTPLNVIILHLNQRQESDTIQQLPGNEINQILTELEQYTYREHSESIYYRKFLRYYNDDIIYLVKPNEKRFWTRSMGLNDADEIILEILTVEHEQES